MATLRGKESVCLFAIVGLIREYHALRGTYLGQRLKIRRIGRGNGYLVYEPVAHVNGMVSFVAKPDVALALCPPPRIFVGGIGGNIGIVEFFLSVLYCFVSFFPQRAVLLTTLEASMKVKTLPKSP